MGEWVGGSVHGWVDGRVRESVGVHPRSCEMMRFVFFIFLSSFVKKNKIPIFASILTTKCLSIISRRNKYQKGMTILMALTF